MGAMGDMFPTPILFSYQNSKCGVPGIIATIATIATPTRWSSWKGRSYPNELEVKMMRNHNSGAILLCLLAPRGVLFGTANGYQKGDL